MTDSLLHTHQHKSSHGLDIAEWLAYLANNTFWVACVSRKAVIPQAEEVLVVGDILFVADMWLTMNISCVQKPGEAMFAELTEVFTWT